ncbi:hypothetical protein DM035_21800 [Salmonella enterica subsp. enterica serovar Kottbus]|uniref:Uncharacterized protein n=1 Tax=Salmonella enterica subsp. enterica serovar Kottbus TaxID=224727 RepID=A0A5U6MFR3_SALET|nr:hypothetical protein [Salmonella enterica subsp. enterica serovar Kottbus]ECA2705125.1 hypothetical protein [Salmonella enterica subsp. enterica serovar Kottbus]EDY9237518.1 hypothetical protein [Salmonella enterica subsp. enterica]EII1444103.1 hypothetical protein [Salmonella enterica subsp. enterica serovar Kottbus]
MSKVARGSRNLVLFQFEQAVTETFTAKDCEGKTNGGNNKNHPSPDRFAAPNEYIHTDAKSLTAALITKMKPQRRILMQQRDRVSNGGALR